MPNSAEPAHIEAPTGLFPIGAHCLAVHGPDAADFLNRLCTWAIKPMAVDHVSRVFFLSPQGRVLAAPFMVRTGPTRFVFYGQPEAISSLEGLLEGYLFSEDLQLELSQTGGLGVHGLEAGEVLRAASLPCPAPGRSEVHTHEGHSVRVIHRARLGAPGYDLWVNPEHQARCTALLIAAGAVSQSAAELEHARVRAGVAAWPNEYSPRNTPLDVGPEGVADQKGCYPGQEVIERIRALGRPTRRLRSVVLSGPVPVGSKLYDGGKAIGRVTSVVLGPGWRGLALLAHDFEGHTATVGDHTAQIITEANDG